MKIEFDPIANALYIELMEDEVDISEEIKPGVIMDYDESGNVLGMEMLYISKREHGMIKKAA